MSKESAYFIARPIDRRHGVYDAKTALSALHGVASVHADPQNGLMCVDYDSAGVSYDKIENCLNRSGFQIVADASQIGTW